VSEPVAVHILDREYLVACPPEQRASLLEAASVLDAQMRQVRNAARSAGLDRIAVLAALNLTHELVTLKHDRAAQEAEMARAMETLSARLDGALSGLVVGKS
jgi:cell division protein ZapA